MVSAAYIAVMIMPAYGVALYIVNLNRSWWAERIVANAAWVYGSFVAIGAITASLVTPAAQRFDLVDFGSPRSLALSLVLAAPLALVAYLVELLVSNAALGSAGAAPETPSGRSAAEAVDAAAGTFGGYAALACITAVSEEYLFRGAMLPALRESHPWPVSLLATAAVFGFHHAAFGVPAVVGKLFSGIAWGTLALWTGTLLAPLVSHLCFQFLVFRRIRRLQCRIQ